MRDFKGMKRQRGRNRGGGKPQHNANRAFESNGPDNVKVRGSAQNIFERYQQLARDAASSGDRVLAEGYLQHAEHYFRTVRAMQPQRAAAEIYGRDQYSSGIDIDFEAEPSEQQASDDGNTDQQPQDGDNDGNRQQQDDQRQARGDRDQQGGGGRNRRDRRDRWNNDRDDRQPRGDREPQQQASDDKPSDRGGKDKADDSPVLRSQDGETSHAPAFLGRSAEPAAEEAPRPRRGRPRKTPEPATADEA